MTRVKICGITSVAEAKLATECGADAIGLLVGQTHHSSDFIAPELAQQICATLPPFVTSVLVTHLENADEIMALAQAIPCTAIQLHSDLSADVLRRLRVRLSPRRIIGKVSVEGVACIERAKAISESVDAILVDSVNRATNQVGGTGMVHDWRISASIVRFVPCPVILAGGLNPTNVEQAITTVMPSAVDVNSGVETSDGKKSEPLLRQFAMAAKRGAAAAGQENV